MNINLIKFSYAVLSIIAGLTVGLVLALYVGLLACLQAFFMFPLQVYTNCIKSSMAKRIEDDSLEQENKDIWKRHIQRMKDQNEKN
jgi:predicted lipid-binding transport protein (Tim44 family)